MKIAVSIDSACDVPDEFKEKNHIFVMPYFVMLGERECRDGIDVTSEDLFKYVNETGVLPKTAATSVNTYEEYFSSILKEYDAIIHFTLSWELTSSGKNAEEASKNLKNVYVIDSKNLSSGIGLLVYSCIEKINNDEPIEQIVEELKEERERVVTSFVIDTLKYLYKGGRCSGVAKFISGLLKIKPRISVENGKMLATKKYMGNINSILPKYIDEVLENNNPDLKRVFVTHSSKMPISASLVEKLKGYGFEEVYDCDASSTISTHCGPNTLGILFENKKI